MASAPDPKDTHERNNRDLAAQEASALWSFWMLVATGFSALITMIGTGFLLWQIMLTRKAVEDTGKATEAMIAANKISVMASRAWVLVEDVKVWYKPEGSIISVTFKNFGQSPAKGLASEVVARNLLYPFWAQPLERATDDFTILDLAPGNTHRREVWDFRLCGTGNQRTRIRISWRYRLPDGTMHDAFEDWVVVEQDGKFDVRQMLPIDSAYHRKNRTKEADNH